MIIILSAFSMPDNQDFRVSACAWQLGYQVRLRNGGTEILCSSAGCWLPPLFRDTCPGLC